MPGSTAGIYQDTAGTTHGYTDIGGVFRTVRSARPVFNQALGINDNEHDRRLLRARPAQGQMGQSAYSQSGGVFTSINALLPRTTTARPWASTTRATSVGLLSAGERP